MIISKITKIHGFTLSVEDTYLEKTPSPIRSKVNNSSYILVLNIFRYSVSKETKYTAVFLSINIEIKCVSLLCLSLRLLAYASFFILGKFSLSKKTPLNLSLLLKYLVILVLFKGWNRTKKFYPCYYNILFLHHDSSSSISFCH